MWKREGVIDRLRARQEWGFFAALFRASRPLATSWWVVLRPAGPAARAVRGRGGHADRRGAARRLARRPAHVRRHRVRVVPGAHAAAPGGERQPREPHGGVAQRPVDGRVRRGRRGWGTSNGRSSPTTSRWRATSTSGITGPPLVDRDGLHRERPRRDGRRHRVGDRARAASPGGRPLAPRRRVGVDALVAARERGVARSQHRRGARRATARRLRVPARGRRARGQGAAALRACRVGWSNGSRPVAGGSTSCSGARRGCARSRCSAASRSCWAPTSSCSGRSPTPSPTAAIGLAAVVVYLADRDRHERDRVRRAELGARRRRRARRRGAAARGRDGTGRRARRRHAPGRRSARARHRVRRRDVRLRDAARCPVLDGFDLTIPAGTSMAIVGQNGAGKTTLAKLLCRLYDPQSGAIEIDGDRPPRPRARPRGGRGSPRCSRTSSGSSFRCAPTSRRTARPTTRSSPRSATRARPTSPTSTRSWRAATRAAPISRAGSGNGSRSARVLCAVRLGAGVVLLDEPTAQLDVRGEAEIFKRILAATRRHARRS